MAVEETPAAEAEAAAAFPESPVAAEETAIPEPAYQPVSEPEPVPDPNARIGRVGWGATSAQVVTPPIPPPSIVPTPAFSQPEIIPSTTAGYWPAPEALGLSGPVEVGSLSAPPAPMPVSSSTSSNDDSDETSGSQDDTTQRDALTEEQRAARKNAQERVRQKAAPTEDLQVQGVAEGAGLAGVAEGVAEASVEAPLEEPLEGSLENPLEEPGLDEELPQDVAPEEDLMVLSEEQAQAFGKEGVKAEAEGLAAGQAVGEKGLEGEEVTKPEAEKGAKAKEAGPKEDVVVIEAGDKKAEKALAGMAAAMAVEAGAAEKQKTGPEPSALSQVIGSIGQGLKAGVQGVGEDVKASAAAVTTASPLVAVGTGVAGAAAAPAVSEPWAQMKPMHDFSRFQPQPEPAQAVPPLHIASGPQTLPIAMMPRGDKTPSPEVMTALFQQANAKQALGSSVPPREWVEQHVQQQAREMAQRMISQQQQWQAPALDISMRS